MRTGTKTNPTATSCLGRTVRWWFGTMAVDGAMCRATTTCPTPARRVSVSSSLLKPNFYFLDSHLKMITWSWFQQHHVESPLRSLMLWCLGKNGRATRPTAGFGTTVRRVSYRSWIPLSNVCLEATGRRLRLPAFQVSSLNALPFINYHISWNPKLIQCCT